MGIVLDHAPNGHIWRCTACDAISRRSYPVPDTAYQQGVLHARKTHKEK